MKTNSAYRILGGKNSSTWNTSQDNITTDLRETDCEDGRCTELSQDRV